MPYKGVVKDNVVILEEGACLPNGTRVAVTVEEMAQAGLGEVTPEETEERRALVARMKEFGQRLAGQQVNLGDLILGGRKRSLCLRLRRAMSWPAGTSEASTIAGICT